MEIEKQITPWLTSKGYNSVIKSLSRLPERRDNDREILLSEKWLTELELYKYGLSPESNPRDIPNIDSVYNLQTFKKDYISRTRNIAVLGMPHAGKDTLLEKLNFLGNKRIITVPEPYEQIKKWKRDMPQDALTQEHLKLAASIGETIVSLMEERKRGVYNKGLIIHNRGSIDQTIFNSARFMHGEIPLSDYFDPDIGWVLKAGMQMDAIFIFIQDPKTSILRGSHTSEEFLAILYEQYLKAIIRFRNNNQQNLVVMDTRENIETNFLKFRTNLSLICGEIV